MSVFLARNLADDSRAEARSPGWIIFLLAIVLLASRLTLVTSALHGSELTTDEGDLTLMALDRYFGAPMANTHWPAMTNQMLMVPALAGDFLLSGRPRNASGFASYAGAAYREPARLVMIHRSLVVALTTLATVALMWTLRRRGTVVMIAAALLLQNVHLITYGTLGLGNGPALAAMIGVVACMLHAGNAQRRTAIAGVLLGIALASRNTSILFAPVLLGFAWQSGRSSRERAALVGWILVGTIVGSAPAWSHALLEPVRWLKANVGNFVKTGPPAGLPAALSVLLSAGGVVFWLITLAAIVFLLFERCHVSIVLGWVAAFACAVVISARSPLVETRYFDAILVGAVALCVLAIDELMARRTPDRGAVGAGVIGVAGVCALLGCSSALRLFDASRAGLRPEERAIAQMIHATNEPIIVDHALLGFLASRTAPASLRTIADQTEAAVHAGDAIGQFAAQFKLSPDVATVFANDLTEKEQVDIIRARVAAAAPAVGESIDLIACGQTNAARRRGFMATSAMPAMLREGRAEEAIVSAQSLMGIDVTELRVEPIGSGKYVRVRR